ncbi:MAG: Trm112 family protein [Thermoproteota archaeon]|nr:Trm112 family protein [Candidatus Brockarchaeota archaeon]MBO3762605.1 Trm112 family protein [Candidatus Brockarchaeota archaeon]MBO3768430.1 Trm112 family protein [Candidatus Brockarchaeota archaeon]
MKHELLDILACPIDKHYPLKLYVISEKWEEATTKEGEKIKWIEIDTGILFCENCNRWFPITDGIPIMLPDELRQKEEDLQFLSKYSEYLPKEIVEKGKPWSLVGTLND